MAKKKFDTNPLDPEFPKKAKEAQTTTLPKKGYDTSQFPPENMTEEQTRRFNEANFNAFTSPFGQENTQPVAYQTTKLHANTQDRSRKVAKVGLPENILTALPYVPWFVGLVAGILELIFVPKSEAKVRYHAAQGLAAHIGIIIVTMILGFADNFFGLAGAANVIFQIVTTIMLIVFAIKAFQGKPIHIESVDALTEWLEEKIQPRN